MIYEFEKVYLCWVDKLEFFYVNLELFSFYIKYVMDKDVFYLKDYFFNVGNYFYELN